MHYTSFKTAGISALLRTSLWEYGQHHTVISHCSARWYADAGRKVGGQKRNINLSASFSLSFCVFQTDTSVFRVHLTTACSLLRNWEFLAQFCISAFSLLVGAITFFNATTIAFPSFSSVPCVSSFYVPLLTCLFLWTPTGVYSSLEARRQDKHSFSATASLWSSHNIQSLRLTPLQCV